MSERSDKHVLFVPYPSPGHVAPTTGVARELVRRGDRVTYALPDDEADGAREAGAEVVVYDADEMTTITPPREWEQDALGQGLLTYLTHITGVAAAVEAALDDDRPDLIAYDTTEWVAGRVLGKMWDVPTVQTLPVFASNDEYSLMDTQVADQGHPTLEQQHPALARAQELMGSFLARHGIDAAEGEAMLAGVDEQRLVFLPRSLQPRGETFGAEYDFVGCCVPLRPADPAWAATEADPRPLVFVSLGTVVNDQPEFFRLCAEALGELPWRVVLATGAPPDDPGMAALAVGLPDNVRVLEWVEYDDVLPHCAVFVSQAGLGSVMHAGRAGVPLIVIPQQPEQRVNAVRLEELGLAHYLRTETLSARTLRETVVAVAADPGARTAMEGFGRDVADAGGASRAADVLQRQIDRHRAGSDRRAGVTP